MASYSNMEDLAKAVQSQSQSRKLMSSSDAMNILRIEAMKLQSLIQKHIDAYYDDYVGDYGKEYSPSGRYKRTFGFQHSLRYEEVVPIDGTLAIRIYFDDILATHDSVMGQEAGFVPLLIEEGWDIRGKVQPDRYHFTHYEGYNFVERAIQEFQKGNSYGLTIKTIKSHG